MEEYVNDFAKMALALASAQLAKETAIKEQGIGEDLKAHFMGWNEEDLTVVAQMKEDVSRYSQADRFERCAILCKILRKHWWVSSLTMVSEGYCSLDYPTTENYDLAVAYADTSLPVFECITVSHVTLDESGIISPVSMVAAPYVTKIGRVVEWQDVLVYPEITAKNLRQYKYPLMLTNSMMERLSEDSNEETIMQARAEVEQCGFLLQELY
jgi:hypothetical protein